MRDCIISGLAVIRSAPAVHIWSRVNAGAGAVGAIGAAVGMGAGAGGIAEIGAAVGVGATGGVYAGMEVEFTGGGWIGAGAGAGVSGTNIPYSFIDFMMSSRLSPVNVTVTGILLILPFFDSDCDPLLGIDTCFTDL